MTGAALIYLDRDRIPARLREFKDVADNLSEVLDTPAHPAHTGAQLIDIAHQFEDESVDHLVIVCHGWTVKLLQRWAGVHATVHRPPNVVSLDVFARAWAPKLTDKCAISLCSCMSSRSPAWYLRKLFEKVPAYWGPHSHSNGGKVSFSARLRDRLLKLGVSATVRGHTTPGHVTNNPTLREHRPIIRSEGESLFNRALGHLGVKPSWRTCRKFNNIVKGELAERWLLFDDTAVEDIRDAWERS